MNKRSHDAPKRDVAGSYPGGKAGAGVYQRIINLIPKHDLLISAFAGHCGIVRHIKPATHTVVIDKDPDVCQWWHEWSRTKQGRALEVINASGIGWLAYQESKNWKNYDIGERFIFCDPPYVLSQRSHGKQYEHEMSDSDHEMLIGLLAGIMSPRSQILICGYNCRIYRRLKPWRTIDHQVPTRGGLQWERIWMNYPETDDLHDFSFIGDDRRERERIRRRQRNWLSQLSAMPPREQAAMLAVLNSVKEPNQ